jgi:hypothetical protein
MREIALHGVITLERGVQQRPGQQNRHGASRMVDRLEATTEAVLECALARVLVETAARQRAEAHWTRLRARRLRDQAAALRRNRSR